MYRRYVGVGEAIRKEYEVAAEDDKQRSIRSTEEVVRREERARYDQELAASREEWRREREQLLGDAERAQQEAVVRESAALEKKLREEFSQTLEHVLQEHEENLQETVSQTWKEAEEVKERAVEKARGEERQLAMQEADRLAQQVVKEKEAIAREAEMNKKLALRNQEEQLRCWHEQEQQKLQEEMQCKFRDELTSANIQHEKELDSLQQLLEKEKAKFQHLEEELLEMTELKNRWEQRHANLKAEFSSFIDQFPGFKGEFILK